MKKHIIKLCLTVFILIAVIAVCLSMAVYRAAGCFELFDSAAVAAELLSFSNGSLSYSPSDETTAPKKPMSASSNNPTEPYERPVQINHTGNSHPISEINISSGDIEFENIAVKDTAPYTPDISSILKRDLPFELEADHKVQVLIYHTHTCESYIAEDSGVYYDDFYPRSTDGAQGVIAVGDRIAEALKAKGIGVVHDKTLHDHPSYEGSYSRSWDTITKYKEKYPSIKVTIDVHRDSMTASDGTKYKPTFTYKGKKAAQIMIMSGYDESGDFPFWDENLIFALKLQKSCEDMYPGMTRPLYFGEFTYNMDFNNGSLLVEFGTDANTVDEAALSGELFGNALSSVLQKG